MGSRPLVISVQHFCLHDGPGVRSLVFFKGCPLRCAWCQNPESWRAEPELGFKAHLCIGCGTCAAVCPSGAVAPPSPRRGAPGPGGSLRPVRDPSRCRLCFTCSDRCPGGALVRFGVPRTVESLLAELRPEFPLYRTSGGGVTLSGGEPTFQAGAAADLAMALRAEGIHVALETCGFFAPSREGDLAAPAEAARLLGSVDLVLFDVKVFDEVEHRRLCGAGNASIKENLRLLAGAAARGKGPAVRARLPLVPGATASEENLAAWAAYLRECGLRELTPVPYHNLGVSKREWLGRDAGPAFRPPGEAELAAAGRVLSAAGIAISAPGEEDWSSPG